MGRRVPLPLALLAATIGLEGVSVVLSWGLEPRYDTILYAVYAVVLAGAGAAIVVRHQRHPIGWLFLAGAVLNALVADTAQGYGLRAAELGWPAGTAFEWLSQTAWLPSGLAWILAFLLFPEGRFRGRRDRWLAVVAVAGTVVALPGWMLSPDLGSQFVAGRNPMAVHEVPTGVIFGVGAAMFLGAFVAATILLVARFVRAQGSERQQLKWLVTAGGAAGVVLPLSAVLWTALPAIRPFAALALTALPVAACVAILRYRLFDIDVVLNRALVYGVLTVVLGATYGATALVIGVAFGGRSAWATAAGTLVVAVAFRPARDRVQSQVDRRFNRARYSAVHQVASFVDDVRAGRAAPEQIEDVLRAATGVEHLELRLFLPDTNQVVDVHGQPVEDGDSTDRARIPIRVADKTIGMIVLDPQADALAVLPVLVDTGALALEITRLRLELRRQLQEVQASRARIAAAAEEERTRIERDLHDGAQQRLVSIGLALRHAQHALADEAPGEVTATLDSAVAEVSDAIDELRELAHGIRPAHLDGGIEPALRDLARRTPIPVRVTAVSDRFPPDIEGAAYFTATEGITNVIKHAQASAVTVRADRIEGKLVVTISDDGVGGAKLGNGSGLTGLSDRVTAHGGTLTLTSAPGRGTTLTAEFPCGS